MLYPPMYAGSYVNHVKGAIQRHQKGFRHLIENKAERPVISGSDSDDWVEMKLNAAAALLSHNR